MTFSAVLVANRGEIAARVFRTCAELGIDTVAVHVAGDTAHVRWADRHVEIASYLDAAAIVEAARASGADAIHPGYGFLSENAAFARAVTDAGLVWIGPTADVIELMGRKDRAREVAERAGVPVMPRYEPDSVPLEAYPVLVKAAAGGGGKGMHVVRHPADLADALVTAAGEAASSFGDDTLLIERYVEGGRHVEVQVFGDQQGHVVHLLDRDCSVQRRHQKVVEEAPAPDLDSGVRERIRSAAVDLCREVGYVNAGTVEFLVAPAGRETAESAYFLEMNTRLQVEHCVTEEVTYTDLVAWQLAVASGEELPLTQDQIVEYGHAVEVRVYAEDPYTGFLPQTGRVIEAWWPDARVETVVDDQTQVTSAFDPMLAKIVTFGTDREEAIAAMLAALDRTAIFGVVTNLGFLHRVVDSATFRHAQMETGWLDTAPGEVLDPPTMPAEAVAVAAAMIWPGHTDDGWRLAGPAAAVVRPVVDSTGERHDVTEPVPALGPAWTDGARAQIAIAGQTWTFERPDGMRRPRVHHVGAAEVTAPMPGMVIAVDVAEGDEVTAGQRLGSVEAMKMHISVVAPHDGTVLEIARPLGAQVKMGDLLFHVEASAESS